jgi:hypothetical protein
MNQGDVMRCTPTQQSRCKGEEEDALTAQHSLLCLCAFMHAQRERKSVNLMLGNQQVSTAIYTKNYEHLNISLAQVTRRDVHK